MKTHYPILLFFFIFSITSTAAQNQNMLFKERSKELLNKTLSSYVSSNTHLGIDSMGIYKQCIQEFSKEIPQGFISSCFEVNYDTSWISDFDNNGKKDFLFKLTDYGLGAGGNNYGYYYIVLLIKNNQIDSYHTIWGGGKYSFTHLEIEQVKDGKIYAHQSINTFNDFEKLEEVFLNKFSPQLKVFEFDTTTKQMVELGYQNCSLAKKTLTFFKERLYTTIHKTNTRRQNDLYENSISETMLVGNNRYTASIEGCQIPIVHIHIEILDTNEYLTKQNILEKVTDEILFLIQNTTPQHHVLTEAYTYILNQKSPFLQNDQGQFMIKIPLKDGRNFRMHASNNIISFFLDHAIVGFNPTELRYGNFWNRVLRKS